MHVRLWDFGTLKSHSLKVFNQYVNNPSQIRLQISGIKWQILEPSQKIRLQECEVKS